MRGRVLRFDLRRLLQRIGGFVVTLQSVVSVAEILVSVRTDLVSFLKSEFVRLASLAEQLDRLQARVHGFLILPAMVVSKTEIVIDLGTAWITFQRFFVDVDRFRITVQSRE